MGSCKTSTSKRLDDAAIPSFFWDRNINNAQLKRALADPGDPQRLVFLRVLLREARPDEVWDYITPQKVADEWEEIAPGLGRRRDFWKWLLDSWRQHGFLE